MDPKVVLIAAALGAAIYGGGKVYKGTRDHVAKPVYHHVLKPSGCAIEKATTLGHKSCKK